MEFSQALDAAPSHEFQPACPLETAMDLLIHVGLHKTGTSTLQNVLHRSSEQLRACGILYPSTGLQGSQHALIPASIIENHPLLEQDPQEHGPLFFLEPLQFELREYHPNLTVISSEVFSEIIHAKADCLEVIHHLAELFDRTTILVTRRQDKRMALSGLKHLQRAHYSHALFNPLECYFETISIQQNAWHFWQESGLDIIEKNLEDSGGNLTDHYLGEILDLYANNARKLLSSSQDDSSTALTKANADELPQLAYLLTFLLANDPVLHAIAPAQLLPIILEECTPDAIKQHPGLAIKADQLIWYLDSIASLIDNKLGSTACISIDQKLFALTQAGFDIETTARILSLLQRVSNRLHGGLPPAIH